MRAAIDMTGKRCGHWTVLKRAETGDGERGAYWLCRCDCGTERVIYGSALRRGKTKSCGCSAPPRVGARKCAKCGKTMRNVRQGRTVCCACEAAAKQRAQEKKKNAKDLARRRATAAKQGRKLMEDCIREANELHMSYGKYVSLGLDKKL